MVSEPGADTVYYDRETARSDDGVLTLVKPFGVTVNLTGQGH